MNLISWVTDNWHSIVDAAAAILISARIIVKLTPTPKDDTFLDSVVEALKHVGLQSNAGAKQ